MMDNFALIAQKKIPQRAALKEVVPPKLEPVRIDMRNASTEKTEFRQLQNQKELVQKLQTCKQQYAPFLRRLAPECGQYRCRTDLTEFLLDGNERITLPHYGGPTGYAKKTYVTQFEMPEIRTDKTYNICFSGVDYITTVYINGCCVGAHEGFFSPFQFEIDRVLQKGINELKIEVENDYSYRGNDEAPGVGHGDKLYAATGLGWDDPALGWHHCPPGMGIYGKVWVETCSRVYIRDLFVRPMPEEDKAELWVEVHNSDYSALEPQLSVSIYGENFQQTVLERQRYQCAVKNFSGEGLCRADRNADHKLFLRKGSNIYKILVDLPEARKWTPDTPWLYQVQVEVILDGMTLDAQKKNFGIRSFIQDTSSEKKGMFYLNTEKIRLRGANTMGFEQWDVLREDFDQLIDDILYAKLCNMNFLRLTQRPVQDEIYDYCDRLGLMTQTDLPLFGVMRRTKFAEGIRQAEEMERLIRSHPCNILVSLINEPFPNAFDQPHRHLERPELEAFFRACESVIKLNNPDRVIKYVDGDYDPPSDNMPDNHCYNLWYNGHTVDIGKLIKGYWCQVRPDWYYGCGEFGVEGLDYAHVMRACYPQEWLKEPFDPKNIVRAQTGNFYRMFYPRPEGLDRWVEESQRHQAESIKLMTEAFRRNRDMVSFAIHLFIDAWPSGWMKTIMDCKRNPKPAYFSYMHALEPVMLSLRTDRFTYFSGEEVQVETWLCNDTNAAETYEIHYELTDENGRLLKTADTKVNAEPMDSLYVGSPSFLAPQVDDRKRYTLTAFLKRAGQILSCNDLQMQVFCRRECTPCREDTVWIHDLPVGTHWIAGETVTVRECPMQPLHFAELEKKHPIHKEFEPMDFRFWYDRKEDRITPIMTKAFTCAGFTPVLRAGVIAWNGNADTEPEYYAVAEKVYEGKRYILNMLDLRTENPVAQRFLDFMNR